MIRLNIKTPNVRGYAFLLKQGISLDSALEVVSVAVDMYYAGGKRRKVEGEDYEGIVRSVKDVLIGTMAGRLMEAELDTSSGKARLRFLVEDRTPERAQRN